MSLKQRAHGSELYGYPIPRRPITFDLRQEPGAGKPHARICAGGEEKSSSLPRPSAATRLCDAAIAQSGRVVSLCRAQDLRSSAKDEDRANADATALNWA